MCAVCANPDAAGVQFSRSRTITHRTDSPSLTRFTRGLHVKPVRCLLDCISVFESGHVQLGQGMKPKLTKLMQGLWVPALLVVAACTPAAGGQDPVDVVLKTELGDITLRLNMDEAPVSAGAFLQRVDEGRYGSDASGFYRIVTHDNDNGSPLINVVQGGLIDVPDEVEGVAHESSAQTGLLNVEGSIALARGDVGTGSPAYFFINVTDNPGLDHGETRNPDAQGFAVFAHVVEGMDVVRSIHTTSADADAEDEYMAGQMLAEPIRFQARRAR